MVSPMGAQDRSKGRRKYDEGANGLSIRLVRSGGHWWGGKSRTGGELSVAATTEAQFFGTLIALIRA